RRTTSTRARRASATGLRFGDMLLLHVAGSLESPQPEILHDFTLRTSHLEQPVLAADTRERTTLRIQPGHREISRRVLLLERLPANGEPIGELVEPGADRLQLQA